MFTSFLIFVLKYDWTILQPSLFLLTLWSYPLKLLYNLPSGMQFRSQNDQLPPHAENKVFISSFCLRSVFSQLLPKPKNRKQVKREQEWICLGLLKLQSLYLPVTHLLQ